MNVTYHGKTYDVLDFYEGSEDWMGYQIEYTTENDNRIFSVGGIEVRERNANEADVYWVDLSDGDFPEHKLFFWSNDFEDGEWATFGDWDEEAEEYEREFPAFFLWLLCDALEEFFN